MGRNGPKRTEIDRIGIFKPLGWAGGRVVGLGGGGAVREKENHYPTRQRIFAETGEKRCEILAKTFAYFRPLISRKSGRKKFHEKSSTCSTRGETNFFHREILGVGGPTK